MALVHCTGFDPSLNNWGIAKAWLDTDTGKLDVYALSTICPTKQKSKQVRQNSKDIDVAVQLATSALGEATKGGFVFVEVPIGSQSARAMASYGICIGILGSLRAQGIPFMELTPTEVKLASAGNKAASKKEMIGWATEKYPKAPWPTYTRNGTTLITEAKAEHMADAVATIEAGITLDTLKQIILYQS